MKVVCVHGALEFLWINVHGRGRGLAVGELGCVVGHVLDEIVEGVTRQLLEVGLVDEREIVLCGKLCEEARDIIRWPRGGCG